MIGGSILRHYFPARLRQQWRLLALSVLATVFGTVVGYVATVVSPSAAEAFLPPEHLQQSPADRVAQLEQAERDGHRMIAGGGENALFTVFLFNNNIRVGVLAFALGITFGVGTLIVAVLQRRDARQSGRLVRDGRQGQVLRRLGRPARVDRIAVRDDSPARRACGWRACNSAATRALSAAGCARRGRG